MPRLDRLAALLLALVLTSAWTAHLVGHVTPARAPVAAGDASTSAAVAPAPDPADEAHDLDLVPPEGPTGEAPAPTSVAVRLASPEPVGERTSRHHARGPPA